MSTAAKAQVVTTAPSAPLAVPYSEIPPRSVHWLHKGLVPYRHVTLVIGPGGTSKGIYTLDYAARMTRGDPMPGELPASTDTPMDVILIAPEDDPNECVAGRLKAAGAALDRVHNLTVLPDGQPFTVPEDIPAIAQAVKEIEDPAKTPLPADGKPRKAGMVILDPLLALAGSDLRTRGQARPVMEALEKLAKDGHLVILLTHHTNADGKAASSRAITETVRNVLTLSRLPKAPEDSPVRLVTVTKTNIGITGLALRYALYGSVESPAVAWACEAPPADVSRGYDVGKPKHAAPPAPSPEPAAPPAPSPAEPVKRYRALGRHRQGAGYAKPFALGDWDKRQEAEEACAHHAGVPVLSWYRVSDLPGMEAAVAGSAAYSVLDRQWGKTP